LSPNRFRPSPALQQCSHLGAPAPLGGILVAILVLSPEGLTAFHAALAN